MSATEKSTPHPFRGRTADWHEPSRGWTVQKRIDGHPAPMPSVDDGHPHRFHSAELPDQEALAASGLLAPEAQGWGIPDHLISDGPESATLPPSGSYPVDHPTRDLFRGKALHGQRMADARPTYDEGRTLAAASEKRSVQGDSKADSDKK